MSERTTVTIGKWEVPKKLFDEYVRFTIMANTYLSSSGETPSHTDYERFLRWSLCVKQVMILHRQICEAVGVRHTEDYRDEFNSAFHREVEHQTRLRG